MVIATDDYLSSSFHSTVESLKNNVYDAKKLAGSCVSHRTCALAACPVITAESDGWMSVFHSFLC